MATEEEDKDKGNNTDNFSQGEKNLKLKEKFSLSPFFVPKEKKIESDLPQQWFFHALLRRQRKVLSFNLSIYLYIYIYISLGKPTFPKKVILT